MGLTYKFLCIVFEIFQINLCANKYLKNGKFTHSYFFINFHKFYIKYLKAYTLSFHNSPSNVLQILIRKHIRPVVGKLLRWETILRAKPFIDRISISTRSVKTYIHKIWYLHLCSVVKNYRLSKNFVAFKY